MAWLASDGMDLESPLKVLCGAFDNVLMSGSLFYLYLDGAIHIPANGCALLGWSSGGRNEIEMHEREGNEWKKQKKLTWM